MALCPCNPGTGTAAGFSSTKNNIPSRSGCPCFPPTLPGAAGWGCCCEYHQPELCHCHSRQKKRKNQSKINAGKCEVRWGIPSAAVAKNGRRAGGMSCGSVEEPSPAAPCPARAEAAQGAVLGACRGLWSQCWRNHPARGCSRALQVFLGWKNSSFTTQ